MFNESKSSATCLAVWSKKGKAPYLAIEIGGAGGLKRFCSELVVIDLLPRVNLASQSFKGVICRAGSRGGGFQGVIDLILRLSIPDGIILTSGK